MAAGDIVNGVGISTTFQPAATVDIAITSIIGAGSITYVGLTDGATSAWNVFRADVTVGNTVPWSCKVMINNSIYLFRPGVGDNFSYSGIQLK